MAPGELTNNIIEIVFHIDNTDWDQVKLTWFLKVMKKDISKYKRSVVSFFGEVDVFFEICPWLSKPFAHSKLQQKLCLQW